MINSKKFLNQIMVGTALSLVLFSSQVSANTNNVYSCPWTLTHNDSARLTPMDSHPHRGTYPVSTDCQYINNANDRNINNYNFFGKTNWQEVVTKKYEKPQTNGTWTSATERPSFSRKRSNVVCEKVIAFYSTDNDITAFKLTGPYFNGNWQNPFQQEYVPHFGGDKEIFVQVGDKEGVFKVPIEDYGTDSAVTGYSIYESCSPITQPRVRGFVPSFPETLPREPEEPREPFFDRTDEPTQVSEPSTLLILLLSLFLLIVVFKGR